MTVDEERLREDIERTGEFGAVASEVGQGRTVLTGSEADGQARDYFVQRLEDAGLTVRVDAVGNIAGRWSPEGADPDAAPVVIGSHLDSVPRGGIFDGPLGVYTALEAVRALQADDAALDRPVDVLSFTEEEGSRFGIGQLGSSVAAGLRSPEAALALTDDEGVSLETHLERIGYRGEGRLDAADWDAFLEAHIEQDTELESAGLPIAVVESIMGITNCRVEIEGEANHAGSTGMFERTDALAAAAEFVEGVETAAREVVAGGNETAVGTVGEFEVSPNARNIVPASVTASMDVRATAQEGMDEIVERARATLTRLERERGVETTLDRYRDQDPAAMSDRCIDAVTAATAAADLGHLRTRSAAVHDTVNVAAVTDAGLLFVPSEDGISHHPREWTDWADCAAGATAMAGAVRKLASE